jgi:hypothetical protein
MKFRPSLIAVLSVVSLPALATTGFTPAPTEAGGTSHAMPAAKTRADVLNELAAWKRNPVTADGWREVGGQAGWVYAGAPSQRTRAEVQAEAIQAKRSPVSVNGWLNVGGEVGAVYVGFGGEGGNARAYGYPAGDTIRVASPGGGATAGHALSRSGQQSSASNVRHGHR